jgi:class 3 adenylate cyclase
MDYGAVGNVTNLASRLCGAAKGGQILTDQKTIASIENIAETEPLGELHLKGLVRPVRAFNIIGVDPQNRVPDCELRMGWLQYIGVKPGQFSNR